VDHPNRYSPGLSPCVRVHTGGDRDETGGYLKGKNCVLEAVLEAEYEVSSGLVPLLHWRLTRGIVFYACAGGPLLYHLGHLQLRLLQVRARAQAVSQRFYDLTLSLPPLSLPCSSLFSLAPCRRGLRLTFLLVVYSPRSTFFRAAEASLGLLPSRSPVVFLHVEAEGENNLLEYTAPPNTNGLC